MADALQTDTGPFSEYLTEADLSKLLPGKPTPRTLRHWRSLGEGPPITRIGIRVFYYLPDVKTWLRDQKTEAA